MKHVGATVFLLAFCFGCTTVLPIHVMPIQEIAELYGPGQNSDEFSVALLAVVDPGTEALSVLAAWFPETYGYENMDDPALDHRAGVLVVTEIEVIFFGWNYLEYAPEKVIPRTDLKAVGTEALGKSRRLVLVSENDLNTFELLREDRLHVDAEGTEAVAALLSNDLDAQ